MEVNTSHSYDKPDQKYDLLLKWFAAIDDTVIIALSGGVDSGVVALAAHRVLGSKALAVTANCTTTSEEELKSAIKVAREVGIRHELVKYDELINGNFIRNDNTRCYHCRRDLADHLIAKGREVGAKSIVDGTHVDDLGDYRPGIKALKEAGIKHPLLEIGLGKSDIRKIAKRFGLSIYNKPANSCLASRIPHGIEITYDKIARIEKAESIIKTIFRVSQVRVRDHTELARIEVGRDELSRMFDTEKLKIADTKIKDLGFKYVSIDIRGYKQGNLVVLN